MRSKVTTTGHFRVPSHVVRSLSPTARLLRDTWCTSLVDHCRDGFDFNELIRAAEDCDALERTWHVMRAEGLANDCPSLPEFYR